MNGAGRVGKKVAQVNAPRVQLVSSKMSDPNPLDEAGASMVPTCAWLVPRTEPLPVYKSFVVNARRR